MKEKLNVLRVYVPVELVKLLKIKLMTQSKSMSKWVREKILDEVK